MNNIEVSVNIPCYNRSEMLKECVKSFLKQTYDNFEIVIADDGSEEDLSFVTNMSYKVKYFRQEHVGMAKAYNLALDNSIGKYIMPFGSDDLALPNLIDEMIELLKNYPDYDVGYCCNLVQKNNGKVHRKVARRTLKDNDAYKAMLNKQYISHGGTLWKKEKMPRYDESLESAVDWELFLTAMENGVRFKRKKKKLWIYRIGHQREEGTKKQAECCDKILKKRGYYFDYIKRQGFKICN